MIASFKNDLDTYKTVYISLILKDKKNQTEIPIFNFSESPFVTLSNRDVDEELIYNIRAFKENIKLAQKKEKEFKIAFFKSLEKILNKNNTNINDVLTSPEELFQQLSNIVTRGYEHHEYDMELVFEETRNFEKTTKTVLGYEEILGTINIKTISTDIPLNVCLFSSIGFSVSNISKLKSFVDFFVKM